MCSGLSVRTKSSEHDKEGITLAQCQARTPG